MSQSDVAEILEQNYPKWMSYIEILEIVTISKRSVMRSLRGLSTRDEVEVMTIRVENSKQKWQTMYRIKPIDTKNG